MAVFTRSVVVAVILVSSTGVSGSNSQTPPASTVRQTAEVGTPASEMLSGNGTTQGYKLARTPIVQGSEWVYIGLRRASRSMDYELDYGSGTIVFTEPVTKNQPVRIDYRYDESTQASSLPSMGFTPKQAPWLEIAARTSYSGGISGNDAKKKDELSVGGLDTRVKIGSGSVVSGAVYMSGQNDIRNPSSPLRPSFQKPANQATPSGRLIVQSADISTAGARFRLGYQSVGSEFMGYDMLRKMSSMPIGDISTLEKEKGLRRIEAAADIAIPNGGRMSAVLNKISHSSGDVVTRILGLSFKGFAVDYAVREVGKGFNRFGDLREMDRGQMSAESGLRRSVYGMRFISQDRKLNSVRVSRIESTSGAMTITGIGLDMGKMKIRADTRRSGRGFNRVNAADDEERTAMAFAVRRHFGSKLDAAVIADTEKQAIGNETGLDRAAYSAAFTGKDLSAAFSINEISAQGGRARSRSFDLAGKHFKLRVNRQSIALGFDRIGDLQPLEREAFGNERGMNRNSLIGAAELGAYSIAFDSSTVNENHGPGMRRGKISLCSPKFKAQFDFKEIDARFDRIVDLSDSDRQQWIGLRGTKYFGWKSSYAPNAEISLDNTINRSRNASEGAYFIEQNHAFALNSKICPKINAMIESRSECQAGGQPVARSHGTFSISYTIPVWNGIKIESLADQVSSQSPESTVKSHLRQVHVESNQSAGTSCTLDSFDSDNGQGNSEISRSLGIRSRISNNLSVYGNLEVARRSGQDNQNLLGAFGLDWAISKELRMKINLTNSGRGPQSGQRVRQFSLNGLIARRLGVLNDIRIGSGTDTTDGCGKRIGCDNSFSMQAGILGGSIAISNSDKLVSVNGIYNSSRMVAYQSDPNPARPVHVRYLRQSMVNQNGTAFITREYSCDYRFGKQSLLSYINKTGWGAVGNALAPLRNCEFKISHTLPGSLTINCGYVNTLDGITKSNYSSIGFGISSAPADKAQYELYYGYPLVDSRGLFDKGNTFNVKFHKQISDDQYITFSARKSIGAQSGGPGSQPTDSSARLDIHLKF